MAPTENQVRQHFLKLKDHLDQIVYSLIRTEDHDMADEPEDDQAAALDAMLANLKM